MHLIIAFAAPPHEGAVTEMQTMTAPALERLLQTWSEVGRDEGDESTLSPPHERAWAAVLGWCAADGCLPWAARQAAADGVAVGNEAWGLLTPLHWRVGSDGVHAVDPEALELSNADSRTLFDAVRPLFHAQGHALAWGAALRWYAAHASLQGLASASIDRVIGRNVDAWLPRQPEAKRLRRLQNEVQMLLHGHPLNQAREAEGRLTVNSFWLSGCGRRQAEQGPIVQLDQRLRGPALQGDRDAWRNAWQAIDKDGIAALLAAAARGEPVRLTLCGERNSVDLVPRRLAWWQRIGATLSPARSRLPAFLESL